LNNDFASKHVLGLSGVFWVVYVTIHVSGHCGQDVWRQFDKELVCD